MGKEKVLENILSHMETVMKVNGNKTKKKGLADIIKIIILKFMKDDGKTTWEKVFLEWNLLMVKQFSKEII